MAIAHGNDDAIAAGTDELEQEFEIQLGGGWLLGLRVTIASTPKVGPGPRPFQREVLLIQRVDEERVLTLDGELRQAVAVPMIGAGERPPA